MQIALVVGHATATVKHPTLEGQKLLVAQPLMRDGCSADGPPLLVVDRLGAGIGDQIVITSDGRAVRELFGLENSPIRWTVLGMADRPDWQRTNELSKDE
ncbi:MAG: hypothetical protein KatS3mg111_1291 [Pirellulaceae bacterium]|nr:MAG: hypothetical protein KatS3mg111_1291 [Pirellulaceae bacterium]